MTAHLKPLQTSSANALIKPEHKAKEYKGQRSEATFHVFINNTQEAVDLFWFHDRGLVKHGTIQPNSNAYVGTYTFHKWKVLSQQGQLLGLHAGASATVTVTASGCSIMYNVHEELQNQGSTMIVTPEGVYRKRNAALGIPVWAFNCVCEEAVQRAVHIVTQMLQCSPAVVVQRMIQANVSVGIVGCNQGITDLPPHRFMRHNTDRNVDKTARGLGATRLVPVSSVGEENLVMEGDSTYPCQSILVHEFGHAVLNLGFDKDAQLRVCDAYQSAFNSGAYSQDIYMMCNEQEYWATGVEAWFQSTIRMDINAGLNTREKLKRHDPQLAALLAEAFGDGLWRFVHDCPKPLRWPVRKASSSIKDASSNKREQQAAADRPGAVGMHRADSTKLASVDLACLIQAPGGKSQPAEPTQQAEAAQQADCTACFTSSSTAAAGCLPSCSSCSQAAAAAMKTAAWGCSRQSCLLGPLSSCLGALRPKDQTAKE